VPEVRDRDAAGGSEEPLAVALSGVTKRFGDVVAVDNITLEIGENRFYALLGPSGCGKTTTLRMIGGFEDPDSGSIRLHGEDVTGLKPYQRPVNTVFQSYALFPHLDIFENVAFGLRRKKVPGAEVTQRVGEMLDLVQLVGMDKRKPGQLSGGQRQRVALARALINHPRVLLLDEPLGALDLKLRKEMQIELKRIQNEVGITFVHVTHDQEEAMTMADTIAVMNEGRIERLGGPTEIYEDPRSAFVAGFLGASNLMKGDRKGTAVTLRDSSTIALPEGLAFGPDGPIQLGVRPEKMSLVATEAAPVGANSILASVVDVSFIGVSTHYLLRTSWGTEVVVVVQNLDDERHAAGSSVAATWLPQHTFVVS